MAIDVEDSVIPGQEFIFKSDGSCHRIPTVALPNIGIG